MTRWVTTAGGRSRGPAALARAWLTVLARPREFFRTAVAPGDQAPGLTFAMAVVLVEEATRLALVPGAIPSVPGGPPVGAALALGVAALLVTPAALHLAAGLQTLLLLPLADERGGVSETVQVVAYASAPCALAGPAVPELRLACTAYGAALFGIGLAEVHGLGRRRAAVAGLVPASLVFGYGFRGFDALATLLARWYVI
ncbi:MAG: YIP1 family protein [Halobacteriales archaeon]